LFAPVIIYVFIIGFFKTFFSIVGFFHIPNTFEITVVAIKYARFSGVEMTFNYIKNSAGLFNL